MQAEFPGLKHVLVAGEPAPGQLALAGLPDAPAPAAGPRPADVSTMLLSGGTTSLSKLIPRTHDDYVLNARLCGAAAGFTERTVLMAILPLGHNYNLASPGMLGAFYHGGTVVLASGASVDDVFALVQRERVTVIAAVVPLITTWLNCRCARRRTTCRRSRSCRTAARGSRPSCGAGSASSSAARRRRSTGRPRA